jgi:hypothetical protein
MEVYINSNDDDSIEVGLGGMDYSRNTKIIIPNNKFIKG